MARNYRALTVTAIPGVAVATSLGFLVAVWVAFPWVAGDTPFVLDGSNAFLTCMSHHDYSACGYTGKLNYWGLMSPIGDWSLPVERGEQHGEVERVPARADVVRPAHAALRAERCRHSGRCGNDLHYRS